MKCAIKILICVFMTLNIAQGQQPDKGIALYQEGKYEQAITAWLELESIQGRNSKINYNKNSMLLVGKIFKYKNIIPRASPRENSVTLL